MRSGIESLLWITSAVVIVVVGIVAVVCGWVGLFRWSSEGDRVRVIASLVAMAGGGGLTGIGFCRLLRLLRL